MYYYKIPIIDLGYVDESGIPVSIDGRDNRLEPFKHLGYQYPQGVLVQEEPGLWVIVESSTVIEGAEAVAPPAADL